MLSVGRTYTVKNITQTECVNGFTKSNMYFVDKAIQTGVWRQVGKVIIVTYSPTITPKTKKIVITSILNAGWKCTKDGTPFIFVTIECYDKNNDTLSPLSTILMKKLDYNDDNDENNNKREYFDGNFFVDISDTNRYDEDE